MRKIVESVRGGNTYEWACRGAGIDPDTLSNWKRTKPEFLGAIKKSEGELIDQLLKDMQQFAAEKNTCWTAKAWLLERRFPAAFGSKVEVKHEEKPKLSDNQKMDRFREIFGIAVPVPITKETNGGHANGNGNGHHRNGNGSSNANGNGHAE